MTYRRCALVMVIMLGLSVWASHAESCTNILVTKGASEDGSVMITYACDGRFHPRLSRSDAEEHEVGAEMEIRSWTGELYRTIREELERETSRKLTLGTVYKTLGRLEGKGYLETRIGPPTRERGGRRKKLYSLTEVGREVARRSLADLRRMMRGLEPELDLS